jgi:hypothetical protein
VTVAEPNKPPEQVEAEGLLCWQLSVQGYSTVEIAAKTKLTLRTVQRRLKESILAREMPTRDAIRFMEDDRLNFYHRHVAETIEGAPVDQISKLAQAGRAISAERRKLWGADEPTASRVQVTNVEPPTAEPVPLGVTVREYYDGPIHAEMQQEIDGDEVPRNGHPVPVPRPGDDGH